MTRPGAGRPRSFSGRSRAQTQPPGKRLTGAYSVPERDTIRAGQIPERVIFFPGAGRRILSDLPGAERDTISGALSDRERAGISPAEKRRTEFYSGRSGPQHNERSGTP